MKFRISPSKNVKIIIVTIFLLAFISMPTHAVLWSNKVDTQDLQRIITELRIYNDPDLPYYNEIFKLYYHDSKKLLKALNNKIEITQQAMKILDADIKKEELGNLTYGRYILNAINEKELVEIGLKTGSLGQANGEYFSKLSGNLADWESQLSKFLLTKIIGATCTAIGAPALSIGVSTLGLFCDLSIIKTNINKLNEVWYEKAFWSYIYFRNEPNNWDHYDAWKGYSETHVKYILNLSLLSLEKQEKARKAIEENFKSLWDKYGEHIVNNKLDKNFKSQQRKSLKILLLYALGSEPHPIITSPLKITPPSPYQVGDIINAEFTIANQGMLPIDFSVLTVGGRDNDNQVADFSHRQNIILKPIESYDYKGTLTLNKVGNYHFFCAYQTPDDEWNTNVDVGSKLTEDDREDDIIVKENIVNQPPDPPANLAQFESDGEAKISIGGKTDGHNIILKGKVNDPDGDKAKLEVEIRRLDEYGGKFDEDKGGLQQSDLFENNGEIMIPIYELANGDYHWRARAIDEHELVSEWISFGSNPDLAVDFTIGQEIVAPIITSPLKITPDPPYYVGDTINAEFAITNKDSIPITFSVLTVGGRDPDNHVADFTHRQNITLEPSEAYNYQGTLTLNKVGDYHFFCTYQTPDGNWSTNVDLGSGLADEDRTEDISVKKKEKPSIAPDISEELYIEWDKTFGGSEYDGMRSIIQTIDGGYAVAGYTSSRGEGSEDVWVIKLDPGGNILWDKTFGGKEGDGAHSILQTNDGGYIVAGFTKSKGNGSYDSWVIKLDHEGNTIWDKTFGGSGYDWAYSIIQTANGEYIVECVTSSEDFSSYDSWVIKLDHEGNIVWDKTFGENGYDQAYHIIQTTDGSYIVAGRTKSKEAGSYDIWVIKLDPVGNILWDKTFGGSEYDGAYSIIQTTDSGYAVVGRTKSKDAGSYDIWVIKLDPVGNILWDKTFGGSEDDWAGSIIQTTDGGYIVAGRTKSKGAGERDIWVIKLDPVGNILWDKTFGGSEDDEAFSIIQTKDGDYMVAGMTNSKGAGGSDAWVIKLSSKSIEALEEEISAVEAVEDKIEKEKLLIDSSLYHFEYSVPRPWGKRARLPVSVSGPADELALILTNPKGETDIKFISKRALIDNFETIYLMMGRESLSEGYYTLTVKTVTPEKVIYKKETLFTFPKDVQITGGEITINRSASDCYTIPKKFNIYFKSDGNLPFFFDEIEIIFTLPGRQIFGKLEEEYKIFLSLYSVPSGEIKYIGSSSQRFYYHGSSDKIKATGRVYKNGKVFLTFPMKLTIEK